ncbi:hypothetical protein [Lentzea sp. NPDC051838]|uniref:hypothetical protein n=1 Tax=Lentzea sp. NPDC051838 TaxID=3154849 RepID=UPI00341205B2
MNRQVERGAGGLVVRAVTWIMAAVVGLTFLFGFGNVLSLGLRLGVPVWVAPLVAPAVDLSILGLLLGIRHLALINAPIEVLRPARRLLIFASLVTLALNVADPIVAGEYGKAAFDAVGPVLLIGWAEVGPGFLQAIGAANLSEAAAVPRNRGMEQRIVKLENEAKGGFGSDSRMRNQTRARSRPLEQCLDEARQADAAHRSAHQKPISAETLRVWLGIGAAPARQLVKIVRAEYQTRLAPDPDLDEFSRSQGADPVPVA